MNTPNTPTTVYDLTELSDQDAVALVAALGKLDYEYLLGLKADLWDTFLSCQQLADRFSWDEVPEEIRKDIPEQTLEGLGEIQTLFHKDDNYVREFGYQSGSPLYYLMEAVDDEIGRRRTKAQEAQKAV